MLMYHGTSRENYKKIMEEGVLWGVRNAPSRCTYLTTDFDEAWSYGDYVIAIDYDPSTGVNNYKEGAWQVREYEPIPISKFVNLYWVLNGIETSLTQCIQQLERTIEALNKISQLDLFDENNMPTGVGEAVLIAKNALLKESGQ